MTMDATLIAGLFGQEVHAPQVRALFDQLNTLRRPVTDGTEPTYGTKNIKLAPLDAADLAAAAQRDVDAMLEEIDEYEADGGCKKAYKKAAKRILKMTNQDFDEALRKILKTIQ